MNKIWLAPNFTDEIFLPTEFESCYLIEYSKALENCNVIVGTPSASFLGVANRVAVFRNESDAKDAVKLVKDVLTAADNFHSQIIERMVDRGLMNPNAYEDVFEEVLTELREPMKLPAKEVANE